MMKWFWLTMFISLESDILCAPKDIISYIDDTNDVDTLDEPSGSITKVASNKIAFSPARKLHKGSELGEVEMLVANKKPFLKGGSGKRNVYTKDSIQQTRNKMSRKNSIQDNEEDDRVEYFDDNEDDKISGSNEDTDLLNDDTENNEYNSNDIYSNMEERDSIDEKPKKKKLSPNQKRGRKSGNFINAMDNLNLAKYRNEDSSAEVSGNIGNYYVEDLKSFNRGNNVEMSVEGEVSSHDENSSAEDLESSKNVANVDSSAENLEFFKSTPNNADYLAIDHKSAAQNNGNDENTSDVELNASKHNTIDENISAEELESNDLAIKGNLKSSISNADSSEVLQANNADSSEVLQSNSVANSADSSEVLQSNSVANSADSSDVLQSNSVANSADCDNLESSNSVTNEESSQKEPKASNKFYSSKDPDSSNNADNDYSLNMANIADSSEDFETPNSVANNEDYFSNVDSNPGDMTSNVAEDTMQNMETSNTVPNSGNSVPQNKELNNVVDSNAPAKDQVSNGNNLEEEESNPIPQNVMSGLAEDAPQNVESFSNIAYSGDSSNQDRGELSNDCANANIKDKAVEESVNPSFGENIDSPIEQNPILQGSLASNEGTSNTLEQNYIPQESSSSNEDTSNTLDQNPIPQESSSSNEETSNTLDQNWAAGRQKRGSGACATPIPCVPTCPSSSTPRNRPPCGPKLIVIPAECTEEPPRCCPEKGGPPGPGQTTCFSANKFERRRRLRRNEKLLDVRDA